MPTRMQRRRFGTGLALGAPVLALRARNGQAQTPAASPAAAVDDPLGLAAQVQALAPADLAATLLGSVPPVVPEAANAAFVVEELDTSDMGPLGEGIVGALLVASGENGERDRESVLGGYLVYELAEAASSALNTYRADDQPEIDIPLMIAGLTGYTNLTDTYADSFLLVGNVIIPAGDAFFGDGARIHGSDSVYRSTVHLVALLDHLDEVTRPEAGR